MHLRDGNQALPQSPARTWDKGPLHRSCTTANAIPTRGGGGGVVVGWETGNLPRVLIGLGGPCCGSDNLGESPIAAGDNLANRYMR